MQAGLLSLSRASLYYQPQLPSAAEVALKHRIDELYTAYPFYGSRRIAAHLRHEGQTINRKQVQRHMREMGLAALYPGPNLSKRHAAQQRYPYLLRDLPITQPNQVWGIDITYIRLRQGWLYLVAILDWFSRYVVSCQLDQSLEVGFVMEAVEVALKQATPQIVNSDQGSHFTSARYTQRLIDQGVQISMTGVGRALDNVFTERLWRTVKYEEVYLNDYDSPRHARKELTRYLTFYNQVRRHQALAYRTPAELYLTPAQP